MGDFALGFAGNGDKPRRSNRILLCQATFYRVPPRDQALVSKYLRGNGARCTWSTLRTFRAFQADQERRGKDIFLYAFNGSALAAHIRDRVSPSRL